jgi:hypothetical protein
MFTGHEHNFQHSRVDGLDHFVTGAAGKVRKTPPDRFIEAATVSWATDCHFLLAKISGDRLTVLPIGALDDPQGTPAEITRYTPNRESVTGPITINSR